MASAFTLHCVDCGWSRNVAVSEGHEVVVSTRSSNGSVGHVHEVTRRRAVQATTKGDDRG